VIGFGDARFFANFPVLKIVNKNITVSSTNGAAQKTDEEAPIVLPMRQSRVEADQNSGHASAGPENLKTHL
jgi:hypothetical protein